MRSRVQGSFATLTMTNVRKRIQRFWRDCGAAEIAEAALVLPLLFVFILAIFQFARVYMIYSAMQRAAQEGAQAAAGSSCATCVVGGGSGNVQLTADQVATQLQPIFNIAHIDYAPIISPATEPSLKSCVDGTAVVCEGETLGVSPGICVQRNVVLGTPTSETPLCGTSVSFVYPYAFSLPSVSASPPYISRRTYTLRLKAQAQTKGEN